MKNYKLIIQYDGTRYRGWQRQKNTTNTIQEKFEVVLQKMCSMPVEIFASGRTDAGVHAAKQIANFICNTKYSCGEIKEYLNHYLPQDILVLSVEEVHKRFHSRLNAVSKTYAYTIATEKPNVFNRKYVFGAEKKPDIHKMRKAAEKLIGKHDFIGFSSVSKTKKSTERTIYSITITELENLLTIQINGSGFLYNMVRILCGTLLEIGTGERTEECIDTVFNEKNRASAGVTLPACGLKLIDVFYESIGHTEDINM